MTAPLAHVRAVVAEQACCPCPAFGLRLGGPVPDVEAGVCPQLRRACAGLFTPVPAWAACPVRLAAVPAG